MKAINQAARCWHRRVCAFNQCWSALRHPRLNKKCVLAKCRSSWLEGRRRRGTEMIKRKERQTILCDVQAEFVWERELRLAINFCWCLFGCISRHIAHCLIKPSHIPGRFYSGRALVSFLGHISPTLISLDVSERAIWFLFPGRPRLHNVDGFHWPGGVTQSPSKNYFYIRPCLLDI